MLKIAKQVLNDIIAHAEQDLPIEACGYLAALNDLAKKHYPLENMDNSATHFTFKPEAQFDVLRDMRTLGLKLRAVYHSHPETPARMSEEDMRWAKDPNISYVIISMKGDHPDVKSFRVENSEFAPEEIAEIDDEMKTHKLDITKDRCPITFVKVKVQLAKLQNGDILEVLLSDGEPLKNVPRSLKEQGQKVLKIEPEGSFFKVLIEKQT